MTVNGGKENSEKDRMFEVAADVIRTLDPSIPADKITQTIEHLKNEQYMVKDYKVTDNVIVETYVPIVELSYGKSACRIDIISKNYKEIAIESTKEYRVILVLWCFLYYAFTNNCYFGRDLL